MAYAHDPNTPANFNGWTAARMNEFMQDPEGVKAFSTSTTALPDASTARPSEATHSPVSDPAFDMQYRLAAYAWQARYSS